MNCQAKNSKCVNKFLQLKKWLSAVEALLTKFDAQIVGKAAVLAEGDAAKRKDIIFLEELPLFFK